MSKKTKTAKDARAAAIRECIAFLESAPRWETENWGRLTGSHAVGYESLREKLYALVGEDVRPKVDAPRRLTLEETKLMETVTGGDAYPAVSYGGIALPGESY